MKFPPSDHQARCVFSGAAITALLTFVTAAAFGDVGQPALPETNTAEIQQLRDRLDQQTRRIDRLYDALGPQLTEMEERAAILKKQSAEDAALAMKEVLRSKDEAFVSKLIFIPNTPLLAVSQNDNTVKLVSLKHGVGETTLTGLDGDALCVAASADGTKIFAGTQTGSIFVWQENATNAHKIYDWRDWPVTALAVSPDGARLVCACNGKYGTNQVWIKPDESLLAIEVASGKKLWGGKAGRSDYQAVSFAGDGKMVAAVQGDTVGLLDAGTGRILGRLEHKKYPSGPLSTVMSHDGKFCAVGYAPNDVGIWDVREGKCLRLLGAHSNWVVALAFSPDGSLLTTSAGDSTASVWDVATGREVGRLRFGDGYSYIDSVSVSDDGRRCAAGRRGEYVVFEMPQATIGKGN